MGRWRWLGTLGETVCASACRRRGFHPTIHARHRANRRLAPVRGETLWWGNSMLPRLRRGPSPSCQEPPASRPATRFRDDLRIYRIEKEKESNNGPRRVHPFFHLSMFTGNGARFAADSPRYFARIRGKLEIFKPRRRVYHLKRKTTCRDNKLIAPS